jgi:hypothetical protein
MSVKVDLDQLADALTDFAFAYLVTIGDDYRAHTVAVDAVLADGWLSVGTVGRSTARNAAAHPDVTLVWPPREAGSYTLIVDGRGEMTGGVLAIVPASAVLHRKAVSGTETASDCDDDCVPPSQRKGPARKRAGPSVGARTFQT